MSKALFALLFTPLFFAGCSTNNVSIDNSLQKYFDSADVKGCFGLFDNGQGHFTVYNLPRFKDSAYQPAATFDIVQSLIAFQTGVAKDDTSAMLGRPVVYFEDATSPSHAIKDSLLNLVKTPTLSLRTAFQSNSRLLSMSLTDEIGMDTLKKWVDTLHYGNRDLGKDIDLLWMNNPLKITADEQLGLIKKLYFDQLPFFNRPQKLVRGMMLEENNSNYRLLYKTGQGIKEDKHAIGWVLGWVEENKHPYFFVVNLESEDQSKDLGAIGLQIVKKALTPMGFFEGKK